MSRTAIIEGILSNNSIEVDSETAKLVYEDNEIFFEAIMEFQNNTLHAAYQTSEDGFRDYEKLKKSEKKIIKSYLIQAHNNNMTYSSYDEIQFTNECLGQHEPI